jgi:copper transport protein
MIAGACWAGGLVLLILLIRERRDDPPVALARRYSTVALSAIAVVVATGLLRSVSELGGIGQLVHIWDSSYGRTLAIKVAVVLVVICLGAINRYRSVGRLATDPSPLRRIASTEVVRRGRDLAAHGDADELRPADERRRQRAAAAQQRGGHHRERPSRRRRPSRSP